MSGRGTIKDDRGAEVALFDEFAPEAQDLDNQPARQAVLAALGDPKRRGLNREEILFLLAMLVPFGAVVVSMMLFSNWGAVSVPIAFVLTGLMARLGRRTFQNKRVAASLVTAGRCASCGYALAQLAPQDDGCVVCPECGGAWRRAGSGETA